MKKAFTLAEIMIVLSVIAVLTAILLPAARNAIPNQNVMKFKKAHNVLYRAINELVTSDKYYLNGDLGTKADGTLLNFYKESIREEAVRYFCNSFADVVSAKTVDCTPNVYPGVNGATGLFFDCPEGSDIYATLCNGSRVPTPEELLSKKQGIDNRCKKTFDVDTVKPQIFFPDGVAFWEVNSNEGTFGVLVGSADLTVYYGRSFSSPNQNPPTFYDENGMDVMYKQFCLDIDGIPEGATSSNCINECPFGYGIRADGKILNGARADEWLQKSIQQKD